MKPVYDLPITASNHAFKNTMQRYSFVSIHHRNIKTLAIKMYNAKSGSSAEVIYEICLLGKNNYYTLC